MAPDASSASAGKKLATTKHWKNLGQSEEVLWGECQGSALYHVRIDLSTFAVHCSCPSRKQPCKHGLGLLLLSANTPESIPSAEHPEWVADWLAKRAASAKRKETQKARVTSEPSAAQRKTAEKRKAQVEQGIERLNLWLHDLVRNGLGSVEMQPYKFWEDQAKQMVDAQAPGLASRLRRMASIPNASPNWPEKLLAQCGQLALLTQAYSRLDTLGPELQEDVRQLIGWSVKEDEVLVRGEHITDEWLFLGQAIEEVERGKAQRTWLFGTNSRRSALILQFAIAGSPYGEIFPPGIRQKAELAYWPGAAPQRAIIVSRQQEGQRLRDPLPGHATIDAFLEDVASVLVHQPWQERFLCLLSQVTPTYDGTTWWICDSQNEALPLSKGTHIRLLALSGGHPVDLAAEWNCETLLPLGVMVKDTYYLL
jgi:hypothetical protein